jgi:hypothetical protein
LWLGLVAKDEIEKGSSIGKKLEELSTKRLADNEKRRASKKGLASANEDAESTEISL